MRANHSIQPQWDWALFVLKLVVCVSEKVLLLMLTETHRILEQQLRGAERAAGAEASGMRTEPTVLVE